MCRNNLQALLERKIRQSIVIHVFYDKCCAKKKSFKKAYLFSKRALSLMALVKYLAIST